MPQRGIDPISYGVSASCVPGHNIAVAHLCVQHCPVIGRVSRSANQGCRSARGPSAARSTSDIDANTSPLHGFVVRSLVQKRTLTYKHTRACSIASTLHSPTVTTRRVRTASPCIVTHAGGRNGMIRQYANNRVAMMHPCDTPHRDGTVPQSAGITAGRLDRRHSTRH